MAFRRPLVLVSGRTKQIAGGDTLDIGSLYASSSITTDNQLQVNGSSGYSIFGKDVYIDGVLGVGDGNFTEALAVKGKLATDRAKFYASQQMTIDVGATGTGGRTWGWRTGNNASGINGKLRLVDVTGAVTVIEFDTSGNATFVGSIAMASIATNNVVTNANLADVATKTIKGRTSASTGDPEDLTAAQARGVLGLLEPYKTADESVSSSTTLQNDDHLAAALSINVHEVEVFARGTIVSGTGIKVALTGSGGLVCAAGSWYFVDIYSAATSTTLVASGILTTFDGSVTVGAAGSFTGDVIIAIRGVVDVTTAGTLTFQFAQHTSTKSNATVTKYSPMLTRKLN